MAPHTVFERNVDPANIDALLEIVLRYVWNNTPRRVANEARRQYAAPSWDRQPAKSRCKRACRLEEREFEHFGRESIQLLPWDLGRHFGSGVSDRLVKRPVSTFVSSCTCRYG